MFKPTIENNTFLEDYLLYSNIKKGDRRSFDALFHSYYTPLCNYSHKFVGSHSAAEDVVQKVFLQLWMKRRFINITGPVSTYLFENVKNESLIYLQSYEVEKNDKTGEINGGSLDPEDENGSEGEHTVENQRFDDEKALRNIHNDIDFIERPIFRISPMSVAWIFAAASVVAIVGFFILFSQKINNGPGPWQRIKVATSNQEVSLPDGSNVFLMRHAELRFPQTFSDTLRMAKMTGIGTFHIIKDTNRPFLLEISGVAVRSQQAVFRIEAKEPDTSISVIVKKGNIEVTDPTITTTIVDIAAGEKAVIDRKNQNIITGTND